jgi:hypothetical protein
MNDDQTRLRCAKQSPPGVAGRVIETVQERVKVGMEDSLFFDGGGQALFTRPRDPANKTPDCLQTAGGPKDHEQAEQTPGVNAGAFDL